MKKMNEMIEKIELTNDPMFRINHDLDKYSDAIFVSEKLEKAKADLAGVDLSCLDDQA